MRNRFNKLYDLKRLERVSNTIKAFFITFTILCAGIFFLTGCTGFLTNQRYVPRIAPEDLKDRLDNGEGILIVDVRSVNAFKTQHIAGAISVPLKEIRPRLDEFPLEQETVFYCT